MLALNGAESPLDGFRFFLAEKLGKTVGELDTMTMEEYVSWQAYYEVRNAVAGMR